MTTQKRNYFPPTGTDLMQKQGSQLNVALHFAFTEIRKEKQPAGILKGAVYF